MRLTSKSSNQHHSNAQCAFANKILVFESDSNSIILALYPLRQTPTSFRLTVREKDLFATCFLLLHSHIYKRSFFPCHPAMPSESVFSLLLSYTCSALWWTVLKWFDLHIHFDSSLGTVPGIIHFMCNFILRMDISEQCVILGIFFVQNILFYVVKYTFKQMR